ncbi:MAG: steryl acetyl hydrolase [Rubrivivax sp.]|nr:MAG: steryl acetyl hydrolase [Rubrivivax sp.]
MQSTSLNTDAPFDTIIIGSGFAGIGMAVALKKAGLGEFLILEKGQDVGGVWRDNTYPGAACDVPSHLYSFSFEPNPNWSRVFAPQSEIHQYLKHCAEKYGLLPFIRFGSEVAKAQYHEDLALWTVTLTTGQVLHARFVVTATGQLSRPVYPKLEGMDQFEGHVFHSARWNHNYPLKGKRVAVIGTGASAIQFVPAIADQVGKLTVFQRSAAYILPRPDGAYAGWRKALFKAAPWTMKLHRARIYSQYESRAVGFTRIKAMMDLAVGLPFKALLRRQVSDPDLRARLTPDYPIGCKRILLSNEYLATMAKPNVKVVTEGIRSITADGIETADGQHHVVDAIVYGTGFAATEFLAPMTITGRDGLNLNDAWRKGAQAYLGMTVPGFPNFFMLYGPNTNLGHSSIIYMLESQIAHAVRCMKAAQMVGACAVEVDAARHASFNSTVQKRLAATVWQGCKSWYVDANGHNSTNWPGFTFEYRWLTRYASLNAYNFIEPSRGAGNVIRFAEPRGVVESFNASVLKALLRVTFKALIRPPVGVRAQRFIVSALSNLMPSQRHVHVARHDIDGVATEVISPKQVQVRGATVLYLHGGGFCTGSAHTHRSLTTRLAASGMTVWVPEYRLAPEHPQPAALEDALACYRALLKQGIAPHQIVVCGDSAGGGLALALALRLRDEGAPMPAGLMLLSPFLDTTLSGETIRSASGLDPMLNAAWLKQAVQWYAPGSKGPHLLNADLHGLPPMLIQVGDLEILESDSSRLNARAAHCGVPCRLEVYSGRWHVFQLQAAFLASSAKAVTRLATFANQRTQSQTPQPSWHERAGDPISRAMAF